MDFRMSWTEKFHEGFLKIINWSFSQIYGTYFGIKISNSVHTPILWVLILEIPSTFIHKQYLSYIQTKGHQEPMHGKKIKNKNISSCASPFAMPIWGRQKSKNLKSYGGKQKLPLYKSHQPTEFLGSCLLFTLFFLLLNPESHSCLCQNIPSGTQFLHYPLDFFFGVFGPEHTHNQWNQMLALKYLITPCIPKMEWQGLIH